MVPLLLTIAGWFFGIVLLLYTFGAISTGDLPAAFFALLLSCFSIPPLSRRVTSLMRNKTGHEVKGKSRSVLLTVLVMLFILAVPSRPEVVSEQKQNQPQVTVSASPIINTFVTTPTPVQETPVATQITPAISLTPHATPTPKVTITTKPTSKPTVTSAPTIKPTPTPIELEPVLPLPIVKFTCDCSKTCEKISSCSEAQYLLNSCDCRQRDADKDGIACDKVPLYCE